MKIRWTPHEDERLTELWNRDNPELSTLTISRMMGRSKNAVIGRARRLELPARPNPIEPDYSAPRPAPASPARWSLNDTPRLLPDPGPLPKHCQWIAGEPSAHDSCKCLAPTVPGRPYCAEHQARAVERVLPRYVTTRSEAAA